MKGVGKEPVRYIPEEDRSLSENEQTIFTLIPKNSQMSNETIRRYARAARDGRDGQRDYDVRALTAADIEEFQSICLKVENFAFSPKYVEDHPGIRSQLDERGYIKETEDPQILADMAASEIPPEVMREIFGVVDNPVKLNRGAKKN